MPDSHIDRMPDCKTCPRIPAENLAAQPLVGWRRPRTALRRFDILDIACRLGDRQAVFHILNRGGRVGALGLTERIVAKVHGNQRNARLLIDRRESIYI